MEGTAVVLNIEEDDLMDLPPGFRFHPTDEEIITHYLTEKVMNSGFSAKAIGEVDMNKCEPWDLPKRAKMGEKEWFFFCQRDRKYPTGMRTNRATESGYWKATGKDKEIFKGKGCLVGMKKTLVFYKGRAPKGEKSNWVMHEYRLEGRFSYYNFPKGAKDEWVVCRVFHKNSGIRRDLPTADSFLDHILDSPSLPPLMDLPTSSTDRPGSSYTHEEDDQFKGASASSIRSDGKGNVSSYFSTSLNNSSKLQIHEESNFLLPTFNAAFKNSYQDNLSHNPLPNSIFCPQNSLPNPNFSGNYHQHQLQNYQHKNLGSIMNYLGSEFKTVDQANSSVSAANQGISDQDRRCKLEQFSSNNSMVSLSQDTALSNDINAEISSSVIKREVGNNRSFEDLEGFPVNHSISDLDSLWDY